MINLNVDIITIIEVIGLCIPVLMIVAFVTIAERKTMASMQRRLGPNLVGYYGLLQAFADALKLIVKECVFPSLSDSSIFFLGPLVTLYFSLCMYGALIFSSFEVLVDLKLNILYFLAISSLGTYGILIAGWAANSKFSFLGSVRSTAQLISYELVISTIVLLVVLTTGSININDIIQYQKPIWLIFPLFPLALVFFMAIVAETNRAPFDLAEAESEIVSGFMTEHSSVVFVFFFLAEYSNIVIMSLFFVILFLGGYLLLPIDVDIVQLIYWYLKFNLKYNMFYYNFDLFNYPFFGSPGDLKEIARIYSEPIILYLKTSIFIYPLIIGVKTSILIYLFIWVRASFPRVRFDQLMSFCWVYLLPILFGYLIIILCIFNSLL
jgi:NADH-ubiquinone oxidoreductase chain 1